MSSLPECCVCKGLRSDGVTLLPSNSGVYLLRFPQNAGWRKNWLDALKYSPAYPYIRQNFRSFADLFICSMHFSDDCFSHGFLKTNALPTKFLAPNRPTQDIDILNLVHVDFELKIRQALRQKDSAVNNLRHSPGDKNNFKIPGSVGLRQRSSTAGLAHCYRPIEAKKDEKTIYPVQNTLHERPIAPSTYPNNDESDKRSILAGLLTGTVIAKRPDKNQVKTKLPNATFSSSNNPHHQIKSTVPSISKQTHCFIMQSPSIDKATTPASQLPTVFCMVCKKDLESSSCLMHGPWWCIKKDDLKTSTITTHQTTFFCPSCDYSAFSEPVLNHHVLLMHYNPSNLQGTSQITNKS